MVDGDLIAFAHFRHTWAMNPGKNRPPPCNQVELNKKRQLENWRLFIVQTVLLLKLPFEGQYSSTSHQVAKTPYGTLKTK